MQKRLTVTGSTLRPRPVAEKAPHRRRAARAGLAPARGGRDPARRPRPVPAGGGGRGPPADGVERPRGQDRPDRAGRAIIEGRPGPRGADMSRRLRERHEDLLRAEIPVGAVSRAGDFRIALCYPNLYYVGMSNLGFQGVFQMFANAPGVVCERAFLPDDVDAEDLARGRHTARQLRERARPRALRRGRVLRLVRERLRARPQDAAHGGHPAARGRPREERPARRHGRRRALPEPGAAGAVRGRDRGGRGRGAGAAPAGGDRRSRPARAPRDARPRRTGFYVPSRYEVALQRRRHGARATTGPAR